MASVTVNLTPALKEFVDRQVKAGGFGSAAEYIEALLRTAQKDHVSLQVDRLLRKGQESESGTLTSKEWEAVEQEVRDSHGDLRLP